VLDGDDDTDGRTPDDTAEELEDGTVFTVELEDETVFTVELEDERELLENDENEATPVDELDELGNNGTVVVLT